MAKHLGTKMFILPKLWRKMLSTPFLATFRGGPACRGRKAVTGGSGLALGILESGPLLIAHCTKNKFDLLLPPNKKKLQIIAAEWVFRLLIIRVLYVTRFERLGTEKLGFFL